jgi:LysM repeat protein
MAAASVVAVGLVLLVIVLDALRPQVAPAAPGAPPATQMARPAATVPGTMTAPAATVAVAFTATPTPRPGPTVRVTEHTIVDGDTLWDIALTYGLTVDEIVAANPGMAPDLLRVGDTLIIPAPSNAVAQAAPQPTGTTPARAPGAAQVAASAAGLRLREGPSTFNAIITKLAALTPLTITGRSADGEWLAVSLSDGTAGWVMARYIDADPQAIAAAPVKAMPTRAVVLSTPAPEAARDAAIAAAALPRDEPYLSGFTTRAREIFQAGQAMGNRANAFALVGDSNSASPLFLDAFERGAYDLGDYAYLQDTLNYFKGSFTHNSPAAVVGFNTTQLFDPKSVKSSDCAAGETPIACEFRLKRPSVALVLIGTNDSSMWQSFEKHYRPIIEYTIAQGIVPVLMTKGDDLESLKYGAPRGYINSIIVKLSEEYGVPLLDLHQVVARLPHNGFGSDGYHYNVPPDSRTTYFTGDHMNYGYTLRNLTALQALDAVRRLIISPN